MIARFQGTTNHTTTNLVDRCVLTVPLTCHACLSPALQASLRHNFEIKPVNHLQWSQRERLAPSCHLNSKLKTSKLSEGLLKADRPKARSHDS